ncbi:hypothetical protein BOX15_Mlig001717g2 [Macrostomum lignano]|uniref:Uncharacterized protein n=1 Tax=Macrostomum lignano TaxID=282301 RepID=A0A267E5C7_9PLAT|nr:hypothetical protein BOX15_Mlig001717g2 [Macrostomum lignano]
MALLLLLWKNFKLKQRQWGKTLAEILAPLMFFLILVAVRKSQDFLVKSPDCQFKPSSLASNGIGAALTSFCFLGVCQKEDTGYTKKPIISSTELSQVNEAVTLYNQLYSNPALSKYRMILDVTPTNWSDPAGSTALNFSSFFNNPSALFDNVTATAAEQALVLGTALMVPSRLNIDTESGFLPLLSTTMAPLSAQLICNFSTGISNDTSAGGSDGWVTISNLCNQTQFKTNLQNQFNVSLMLNQVKSTESDKYTLPMNVTDLPVLSAFVSQASTLMQTNTAFGQLSKVASGLSSDIDTAVRSVSKLLCGAGETTIISMFSQLSSKVQDVLKNASTVFSAANPIFALCDPRPLLLQPEVSEGHYG